MKLHNKIESGIPKQKNMALPVGDNSIECRYSKVEKHLKIVGCKDFQF